MPDAVVSVAETAPAKINLALHVTGRRSDGYHLLESLVVFTEFGDRLTVGPAERDTVEISGPFGQDVPADDGNLVVRARNALRAFLANSHSTRSFAKNIPQTIGSTSTAIHLEKNLPIASGIGGGSSDAAAALSALNRFWNAGLSTDRLAEIGLPLGADVPMCLKRQPLIARGIGEAIEPIAGFPALPIVLVNPGVGVSTPRIFGALASHENPPLPLLQKDLNFETLRCWLTETRNDLMAPALSLEPPIGEALDALTAQNATFVRMSGSGATCFGLFANTQSTRNAAAAILAARPGWFVIATQTGSAGREL